MCNETSKILPGPAIPKDEVGNELQRNLQTLLSWVGWSCLLWESWLPVGTPTPLLLSALLEVLPWLKLHYLLCHSTKRQEQVL